MKKMILVNMPFSDLALPSIALTQLKAVVEEKFQRQIAVEIAYLSHDFAKYLGLQFYDRLTNSMESLNTGLGDWFFRQSAFPELQDNTEEYFRRYFPITNAETQKLKNWSVQARLGLEPFMDQMIMAYQLDSADIVGFTSMFMQNSACFAMARMLKARNPKIVTLIGGANCEYPMGRVIAKKVESMDFVFSGPALKSLPEFLEQYLNGELRECQPIRGVFSKRNQPIEGGPQAIGDDLSIDTEIKLDYESFLEILGQKFPNKEVKPVLPFETSRGCWWGERAHCTFCGLNGVSMGYRAMSPDRAIALFNSLFRYSGQVSRLSAVDNILPKSYLKEVLPNLETPAQMSIFYEVKADLSEEDIATLARARVNRIQPGIESLATSTLKLMKKGTTVFQNLTLLKRCALYDVEPVWNLLVGFPGETEAVYQRYMDVLPLVFHLPPPSGVYPVRFDRFSPYYTQAKAYGLDLHPLDFYSLIYPFEEADFHDFAYYFVDRNIQAEYFTAVARWLGKLRAKVSTWQALWSKSRDGESPRLCCTEKNTIYDSRSGQPMEYCLGETGMLVLKHLAKPTRIAELSKTFAGLHKLDISREIAELQEKGLIFQEGDRLFSLLLEGEYGSRPMLVANEQITRQPASSIPA